MWSTLTISPYQPLPLRSYFDECLIPVLLPGLAAVAAARPDDPVSFLAHFMLRNNPKRGDTSLPGTVDQTEGGLKELLKNSGGLLNI